MRTLQILIVDDDEHSLRFSRSAMEQLVEPTCIHCARTAAETMRILSEHTIELAFLDIDMPDTNGFSIAEYIGQHCPGVQYIFLTGYADFAARSYEYEALDYLIKPVDLMRLQKALERYESRNQQSLDYSKERVAMDTNEGFVLLSPAEIAYMTTERRLVKVRCLDGREYSVRHTLDEVEAIFSDFGFFRIHQSYLAPLSNIISIRPSKFGRAYEAVLSEQICLPVSRDKYQKLRSFLISRGVQFI